MEELTIEQKAQRYDKALERAKSIYNETAIPSATTKGVCTYIFHELKESEDEKIRKELIELLNDLWAEKQGLMTEREDYEKYVSWLEKQGDNTPTIIWHNINEKPEEMKELFCEWESDDATWHDVAFYDEESHTFRHAKMPINVTKWVYVDELLEKQGEHQKFIDSIQIGDIVTRNQDGMLVNLSQLNRVAKPAEEYNITGIGSKKAEGKLGEMINKIKSDKIEPKFKVGDWVVFKNKHQSIYQVEKTEDGVYILRHTQGGTFRVCVLHDESLRLWTIEDAKDGDVLTTGNFIFIFKRIVLPNDPMVVYYCAYEIYQDEETVGNGFYKAAENSRMGHLDSTTYYPATKEQCDLLFQKMEEAGYSWDAEKKKLKKIKRFEETLNNPIYKQLKNKKHYESN